MANTYSKELRLSNRTVDGIIFKGSLGSSLAGIQFFKRVKQENKNGI